MSLMANLYRRSLICLGQNLIKNAECVQLCTVKTLPAVANGFRKTTNFQQHRSYHGSENDLNLNNVVLLCKVTRYEYEKHIHPNLDESELEKLVVARGSDFGALKQRHEEYLKQVEHIQEIFSKMRINVQVVRKFDYAEKLVDWADAIFTAGGDGTFLMAASKVKGRSKPVIGINTDPVRSEGYLCLPKEYSHNLETALSKITSGKFKWQWRQRIRMMMRGKYHWADAVDLHQQQILFPEHRFVEHVQENEMYHSRDNHVQDQPSRQLPILALNEVFIGESLSARVSFYHLSIDGSFVQKQKSSGVTVCTGTGSTSWFFNINHLSNQSVRQLMQIAQGHGSNKTQRLPTDEELGQITDSFNNSLRFDPGDLRMAYSIRDPVYNAVFQVDTHRGFCNSMSIQSGMWDGWIVVDGGVSFRFNDGAIVDLSVQENDALRCLNLD